MAIEVIGDYIGSGSQDTASLEGGVYRDVRSFLVTGLEATYTSVAKRRMRALQYLGAAPSKIPAYGDAHPDTTVASIVVNKSCTMLDADKAIVKVSYGQPEVAQWDAQLIQGTSISIGTTSSGVESNIDGAGDTIETEHTEGTKRVQSISSMESMSTLELRQLQADNPWTDAQEYVRSVNLLAIGEVDVGCLYCQSITGEWAPEAQQWIASYTFVYRAPYTAAIFGNEAEPFEGWEVRVIENDSTTGQPFTRDKWVAGTVKKVSPYPHKDFTGLNLTWP